MNKFDGLGFIFGWVGTNCGRVFGLFLHVELPHWVELHHFCFLFLIGLSENKRNLSQEGGREEGTESPKFQQSELLRGTRLFQIL